MSEELLALERRTWAALTSEQDAEEFYDYMLSHDMVMVLPSMVLERSEALESWLNSVPWHDFELADARTMYLGKGAALLTYRATARQGAGRAQLPRAVHQCLSQGRWALAADVPAADTVEQQHRLRWVAGPS